MRLGARNFFGLGVAIFATFFAAFAHAASAASAAAPAHAHDAVPQAPVLLNSPESVFPVTNSMVFSWLAAVLIIVLVRVAIGRRPRLVPSRGQAVVEGVLVWLRELLEPIVGKRVIAPAFPLLASFFIYILLMNWGGVLLGFFAEFLPFLRPANADLNTTLALALISFGGWLYFVLRYAGLRTLAREVFGNKAERSEVAAPMYVFLTVLFLAVGVIEVISILFRPVSLAFRLYGNVFGGENLIHQLGSLAPFVVPAAASFLELLIGLIQALVFTLLSAVYIGLVCNHGDEHEHISDAVAGARRPTGEEALSGKELTNQTTHA
jgi:F-type H+-transporting ATPase subunit a